MRAVDVSANIRVEGVSKWFGDFQALKPDLAQAYHNLGGTYHTARDYVKAEAAFNEALKRDPDNFDTLIALGAVLKELGRLEESLECLRRAYALRPGDPGCTTQMVLIMRQTEGSDADVKPIADAVVEPPPARRRLRRPGQQPGNHE